MKHSIQNNVHAPGVVRDNLALSRMLIDLIHRYLTEGDEHRRKQIFSEISRLRDISIILNRGK
jgi:hypothetical protein